MLDASSGCPPLSPSLPRVWQRPWGSTVNVALPEKGFLLLISSRQVLAFSTAWLFGEKCHLSSLPGGNLVEMLPAGAGLRLSCRRHLVGKGENGPKVKEGGCRNSVSLWENCSIQHKAALGHASRAEFGYLQQNSLQGNDEVWRCPKLEHSLSRMGLDLFVLKIDFYM